MDTKTDYGQCQGYVLVDGEVEAWTCESQATQKIMGERDSFGCEWLYLCDSCSDTLDSELDRLEKERQERAKKYACSQCREVTGDVRYFHHPEDQYYEPDILACGDCIVNIYNDLDDELYGPKCDVCKERSHDCIEDYTYFSGLGSRVTSVLCPECHTKAFPETDEDLSAYRGDES